MKNRLKEIRLALGYNQQEMADKLDIPVRVYRNYEYVSKGYPVEFIQKLIYLFSVNSNYLFTGLGSMFISSTQSSDSQWHKSFINQKIFDFGLRIAKIQENTGLSEKDFARNIGLFKDEFIEFKCGCKAPTIHIIDALKQYYKISADFLLYGE